MRAYTPPEAPTRTASLSKTDVATDPETHAARQAECCITSNKWLEGFGYQ